MFNDEYFINIALQEAERAYKQDEIPIGAVITHGETILAQAHNEPITLCDPTAHAEILAIRKTAQRIDNYRLLGTTLYVTVEPCVMCAGAIIHARISRIVFGATDPKAGGIVSCYNILSDRKLNHSVSITGGILKKDCSEILGRFFQKKRVCSTPIIRER